VKTAVSSNYFTVFLLLYGKTIIYSFQSAASSTKFNDFTSCNAEHHMQKEFMGIPLKKKVVETGHRFCEVRVQDAIPFTSFS
jgi:hypothetical protein